MGISSQEIFSLLMTMQAEILRRQRSGLTSADAFARAHTALAEAYRQALAVEHVERVRDMVVMRQVVESVKRAPLLEKSDLN